MSTLVLHIVELVKSLPPEDQMAVREALARETPGRSQAALPWEKTADGGYLNPEGIPNDDPIFRVLEEIEGGRSQDPGPPAPVFD